MNLLTFYPIQSCNLSCKHCQTKGWLYPVNDEKNKLNNKIIFNWLDMYCSPKEWLIEITGGEPSLYPQIESLVLGLNERGYHGLIRTNGILSIPKTENFHRIAGWHYPKKVSQPPKYFDSILITKNPDDKWNEKLKYCINNKIPYILVPYKRFGISADEREKELSEAKSESKPLEIVKTWTVAYSSGNLGYCFNLLGTENQTMQSMEPPLLADMTTEVCILCDAVVSFELCMPDELKKKIISRVI
jgi:organic radical activating enzyme